MRVVPSVPDEMKHSIVAASTEDGRIVFYDLSSKQSATSGIAQSSRSTSYPVCRAVAQLGGAAVDSTGRIKDFQILVLPSSSKEQESSLLCVAGSSDGAVRLWQLHASDLSSLDVEDKVSDGQVQPVRQVGTLVGTQETGSRITCIVAFVMDRPSDHIEIKDDEDQLEAQGSSDSD
jgi:protein MAK11